jgi:hypothetical protein
LPQKVCKMFVFLKKLNKWKLFSGLWGTNGYRNS